MSFDPAIVERARAVNMLVVTEQYGLKLAKRRQEYIGACPHCGGCSRFSVNPGKAVFLCRGCNAGGCGAIDLKVFISRCSFTDAIEALTGERMPSADEARAAAARAQGAREGNASRTDRHRTLAVGATPGAARHHRRALPRRPRLSAASFRQRSATCQRATNIHPP